MKDEIIKVLVIEDDEEDFLLARHYLSNIASTKYVVDWESDFEKARMKISEQDHDVCLVDYNLSVNNGLELVQEMTEKGINTPFIFLTGIDNYSTDLEAMEAGATDYLIKGEINEEILERTIRYALKQKQIENELIESNNTKTKLFSIIGHDLRSPIGTIMTTLQLFSSNKTFPEEVKNKIIKELYAMSKSTYSLLENLLNWAKIQQSNVTIEYVKMYLEDICTELCELLKAQAEAKNIELLVNIPVNKSILSNREILKLILRNLITNAIKFTAAGGKVELSIEEKNNEIIFAVKDNGIGMDETTKELVNKSNTFFTRPGTENEVGSGLGIQICREYVHKLKGELWFESEVNEGTTFFFSIPVVE